jgi:hypothetical protein
VKGIQSEGAFLSIQTFRAIQKMDEWQDFIHAGGKSGSMERDSLPLCKKNLVAGLPL